MRELDLVAGARPDGQGAAGAVRPAEATGRESLRQVREAPGGRTQRPRERSGLGCESGADGENAIWWRELLHGAPGRSGRERRWWARAAQVRSLTWWRWLHGEAAGFCVCALRGRVNHTPSLRATAQPDGESCCSNSRHGLVASRHRFAPRPKWQPRPCRPVRAGAGAGRWLSTQGPGNDPVEPESVTPRSHSGGDFAGRFCRRDDRFPQNLLLRRSRRFQWLNWRRRANLRELRCECGGYRDAFALGIESLPVKRLRHLGHRAPSRGLARELNSSVEFTRSESSPRTYFHKHGPIPRFGRCHAHPISEPEQRAREPAERLPLSRPRYRNRERAASAGETRPAAAPRIGPRTRLCCGKCPGSRATRAATGDFASRFCRLNNRFPQRTCWRSNASVSSA